MVGTGMPLNRHPGIVHIAIMNAAQLIYWSQSMSFSTPFTCGVVGAERLPVTQQ
ncbi:hypothetical protein OK016_14460 [Vibrio chagasii]|nr:hypothetical protein [Vibrio chagasii]